MLSARVDAGVTMNQDFPFVHRGAAAVAGKGGKPLVMAPSHVHADYLGATLVSNSHPLDVPGLLQVATEREEEEYVKSQRLMPIVQSMMGRAGLLLGRLQKLSDALTLVESEMSEDDERVLASPPLHSPSTYDSFDGVLSEGLDSLGPRWPERNPSHSIAEEGQLNDILAQSQSSAWQPADESRLPPAPSFERLLQLREACFGLQELQSQGKSGQGPDAGQYDEPPLDSMMSSKLRMPQVMPSNQAWPRGRVSSSSSTDPGRTDAALPSMPSYFHSKLRGGQLNHAPAPDSAFSDSLQVMQDLLHQTQLSENRARAQRATRTLDELLQAESSRITRPEHVPVNRDPDVLPPRDELTGAEEHLNRTSLPSFGSSGHFMRTCKPCLFWYGGMCLKGERCHYCHIPHNLDEVKKIRPSKATRNLLQQLQNRATR